MQVLRSRHRRALLRPAADQSANFTVRFHMAQIYRRQCVQRCEQRAVVGGYDNVFSIVDKRYCWSECCTGEKASHFQTLLAVPNRHKNMLAKLTYLYGSGVFALFFLFVLFVIGIHLLGMADTVQLGMLIGAATGMAFFIVERVQIVPVKLNSQPD